jgi:two-component system chemotaxis response regulator CheB
MGAQASTGESHRRDTIVIGGSAGSTEALTALLPQLSPRIPAAIFVVTHLMPDAKSHLVDALNTVGPLVAKVAEDGEDIAHGMVYVAPTDRHLLVRRGSIRITRGPRENRWRPAVDPLFRSAAVAYGPRVIGVVLSGMLDDGTAGLDAIKRCGGVAVVQDPEEAAFPDMPRSALANVAIDHTVPIAEMGPVLERLMQAGVAEAGQTPRDIEVEARIAETGYSDEHISSELGDLSDLSCAECGGPLWKREAGDLTRYRCRVGHAYTESALLSAGGEAIESSIWAAVRLFDQRANILTTMAEKDRAARRPRMVEHHAQLAGEAREHANVLRRLLMTDHR